jgi:hypothetical protein
MYSGEYDASDVTLSVYPHRTSSVEKYAWPRWIFQACPAWIYTQSNITIASNTILFPELEENRELEKNSR